MCGLENGMKSWQIFTRELEILKIGTFMGPFIQSRKCMSLKCTGKLCIMAMKNDAKFENELTCQFKIDVRNLTNLDPINRKSKN